MIVKGLCRILDEPILVPISHTACWWDIRKAGHFGNMPFLKSAEAWLRPPHKVNRATNTAVRATHKAVLTIVDPFNPSAPSGRKKEAMGNNKKIKEGYDWRNLEAKIRQKEGISKK